MQVALCRLTRSVQTQEREEVELKEADKTLESRVANNTAGVVVALRTGSQYLGPRICNCQHLQCSLLNKNSKIILSQVKDE